MEDEHPSPRVSSSRVWRALLLVLGSTFLAIGLVGIVVPVLPTTPFLILAAVCYGRGSVRAYRWLVTNRMFGRYLSDYLCGRGVPRRVKTSALVFLWVVIGPTAAFLVEQWWLRGLLLVIGVAVTVHIVLLKGRGRDG